MPAAIEPRSKSLQGVTDLVLLANIKPGLIPALDARSYASRVRLLLKTVNTLRVSSLEAEPTPLIADAVTRIRAIHSFRLALIDNGGSGGSGQLLLNVVFDGGWEPYMRRIWRDLGPLLDVIFCNCEGYLNSRDHGFADYAAWVRRSQVDTEFLYNASPLTVNDLVETVRRPMPPAVPPAALPAAPPAPAAIWAQAMPGLMALYRLSDMYPMPVAPEDGRILLRAARHLLRECVAPLNAPVRTAAERAALTWFMQPIDDPQAHKPAPSWPDDSRRNVQSGIVDRHPRVTHGGLVLVHLADAAAAAALLAWIQPQLLSAAEQPTREAEHHFNVAFTLEGLHAAGVDDALLAQLPREFQEGMAARASVLGDTRQNHPTRWRLPRRNWPVGSAIAGQPVALAGVHALVLVQVEGRPSAQWQPFDADAAHPHPLHKPLADLHTALADRGVTILAVQPMQRFAATHGETARGHFGFVDGISQPVLAPPTSPHGTYNDQVPPGDLLLGHENSLHDKPQLEGRLWKDSTFVVVRKLRQYRDALDEALAAHRATGGPAPADMKAQMMGRTLDGETLHLKPPQTTGNNFNYEDDPDGKKCPFQAHARRANPRHRRPDQPELPRLLRRGMSYGPTGPGKDDEDDDQGGRGLVFMAYNASIAEQFEVIQSWLAGGNSSDPRLFSGHRDAFLGMPREGEVNEFVYHDAAGTAHRLALPADKPFVTLEWGLYAFVPSLAAVAELRATAEEAARRAALGDEATKQRARDRRAAVLAARAQAGARLIARLRAAEQHLGADAAAVQWKIALEDLSARMSGASQAIWAAVRLLHGGVLRTPYGVLVASHARVHEVLGNDNLYSVGGYMQRMQRSFGAIYLGLDGTNGDYHQQSAAPNAAISAVGRGEAFHAAFRSTQHVIWQLTDPARGDEPAVEVKEIVDEVLADLCVHWFGLPDGVHVQPGGWHWNSKPTCPGHFHSPSRWMFQPNPGDEAAAVGEEHGKALKRAVVDWVRAHRKTPPAAPIADALFAAIPPPDDDRLAATLIGVMMGFLPTVDGNLRGVLYEWVNDRSLWDLQLAHRASSGLDFPGTLARAERTLLPALVRTMQLRPVPEVVWRTARGPAHALGNVTVEPGDKVVASLVSATQESLADEDDSEATLYTVFGGNRRDEKHPTHACPGYEMALGVMLGVLAALVETASMRATFTPVSLRMGRL
ncbi:MAG: Dyp-type peroxidase [Betaproteobacteria bacterium]|nr:Dyp-type peroxidase [Betaproteobacteria bacterium]